MGILNILLKHYKSPHKRLIACCFSLNDSTFPDFSDSRNITIRSSIVKPRASTPSSSSFPGIRIPAANRHLSAIGVLHTGHTLTFEQSSHNSCPHGSARCVAISYSQYPHSVCGASSPPVVLSARSRSTCATERTRASNEDNHTLFALGICSSYRANHGSFASRYVCGVTGEGGLGRPVMDVKYATLRTLMCTRLPLCWSYATTGSGSRLIFCEILPPAAKPAIIAMWSGLPPPRRRKTRYNVASLSIL